LTHGRKRQTLSTKAQTDGNEERGEEKWVPHKIWNSILWHYNKALEERIQKKKREREREGEKRNRKSVKKSR
jgi:hypothetical protein